MANDLWMVVIFDKKNQYKGYPGGDDQTQITKLGPIEYMNLHRNWKLPRFADE